MNTKRKLLKDYLDKIENPKIKKLALHSLMIEKNQQKPKTEKIRNIKSAIEKIVEDEN